MCGRKRHPDVGESRPGALVLRRLVSQQDWGVDLLVLTKPGHEAREGEGSSGHLQDLLTL